MQRVCAGRVFVPLLELSLTTLLLAAFLLNRKARRLLTDVGSSKVYSICEDQLGFREIIRGNEFVGDNSNKARGEHQQGRSLKGLILLDDF